MKVDGATLEKIRFRFRFICEFLVFAINIDVDLEWKVLKTKLLMTFFLGRLGGRVLAVIMMSFDIFDIYHCYHYHLTSSWFILYQGHTDLPTYVAKFISSALGVRTSRGLFARVPTQCNHAEETCHDGFELKVGLGKSCFWWFFRCTDGKTLFLFASSNWRDWEEWLLCKSSNMCWNLSCIEALKMEITQLGSVSHHSVVAWLVKVLNNAEISWRIIPLCK